MDEQGSDSRSDIIFVPDVKLAFSSAAPPGTISYDGLVSQDRQMTGEGAHIIGSVTDKIKFSSYNYRLMSNFQNIKIRGSEEHRLPYIYKNFEDAIRMIAAYEKKHSPLFKYKEAYLTVKHSQVREGYTQGADLGWHLDRRARGQLDEENHPLADHIYLVSDCLTTELQKHPLKDAFNELAAPDAEERGLYTHPNPYQITLMTNFCYHKSQEADVLRTRSFMRIIYPGPDIKTLQALPKQERKALGLDFL